MANILVVDDDDIVLKTIHAALIKDGHTAFLVKDGLTAIEKVRKDEPLHLIVTDINMPHGVNGFNLIKMIRENPSTSNTPIMIVSTRRTEDDVKKGIQVGVDDYIVKPIDFDIFVAKVKSLLTRGAHSFTLSHIESTGTIEMPVPIDIVGISEEGVQILCNLPLEPNSKINFNSDLFGEIGINSPMLRVSHWEKLESEDRPYTIKLNFIGLTPGDLQKIRVFANKARLKPRE